MEAYFWGVNSNLLVDFKPEKAILRGTQVVLDPLKAMFLPASGTLLISDLHLGKAAHFRKNGLAMPNMIGQNNLWNLSALVDRYEPQQCVFLGDLFHSHGNHECDDFVDWQGNYPGLELILVNGNHDILSEAEYEQLGLQCFDEYTVEDFRLVHDIELSGTDEQYTLSGHIHPCVRLAGRAGNSMRLACFWFAEKYGVLPAFGDFTGTYRIKPKKGDQVYVCAGKVIRKF